MKIRLRILLGYFAIVGLAAWFVLNVFMEQVKPGVRATQEDTMVDTANMLALLAADDVQAGRVGAGSMLSRIAHLDSRPVDLTIHGFRKQLLNYRVYITDARGIVIFDSTGKALGADYSRWNDVYLTLRGKYGARSTRAIYGDESSTVMHVAAPIRVNGRIIGSLTVAKPNATVQPFIEQSQRIILQRGAVLLGLSLLIGVLVAWGLTRSLDKLMHYIGQVEAGEKATLPPLANNEIGRLGRALEDMRNKLEGKQYVEELMHTLAHELKSPIAAIQGSAELLLENPPDAERRLFLANILEQNARQKQLIDKLLDLIRVEQQQGLAAPGRVQLAALAAQVRTDCAARMGSRGQTLEVQAEALEVPGDALLLRQALCNLLDNAIDFSPPGAVITLAARRQGSLAVVTVTDQGAGIPPYAQERLFERFYSLARPDSARSTGLGLPFVREVSALHRGSVTVVNRDAGGAVATLHLPLH